MIKCPKCNNSVPDGSRFCNYCGEELVTNSLECPNCHSKDLPLDSKFCPDCGCRLDDAADDENEVREFTVNGVSFTMVKVEAGFFEMGRPYDDERHDVFLTRDYYIGQTQVTQRLWEAVMGYYPSLKGGLDE